ncbi:MAG: hypothetical protein GY820_37610 [Gammaproteobacteria bacterium]|nr:hypothetical protein [Gammaproteobacteria bacterium]
MHIIRFLGMVALCYFFGFILDYSINHLIIGQYCQVLWPNQCLIPSTVDHWLTAGTILLVIPASVFVFTSWFINSKRCLSIIFGWLLVAS